MQRNFRIFDDLQVTIEDAVSDHRGLTVTFTSPRPPPLDKHTSFYDWDFLGRYLAPNHSRSRPNSRAPPNYNRQTWGSEIAHNPPTVDYEQVMASDSNHGLAKLMDSIARFGLVFVDNTPFDDAVHTKKLLERIGPIRETHYGGFYDFIPDMAKADTAYTNIALPAHTDTTYFTDPAGLQAFHLLSHTAPANASEGEGPSGGQSLLVDGYRALDILQSEASKAWHALRDNPVPWHASGNEGVTITPRRLYPVFDYGDPRTQCEHIVIRWNNDDRGGKKFPLDSLSASERSDGCFAFVHCPCGLHS